MKYWLIFGGLCAIASGIAMLSLLTDMFQFTVQMHVDTDAPWWVWLIYYVSLYGAAQFIRGGLNVVVGNIREIRNPNADESH